MAMQNLYRIPAAFLEKTSLYRKVSTNPYHDAGEIITAFPPLNMFCPSCDSVQTFSQYFIEEASVIKTSKAVRKTTGFEDFVLSVRYHCAKCRMFHHWFGIRFSKDGATLMKVGQFPAWFIEPPQHIKKALGIHLSIYKQGLLCESEGFGIGAFAYYRRIIEGIIDDLLKKINELWKDDSSNKKYMRALSRIKESHKAEEKIDKVKDLIPQSLRPGGLNPLSQLHSAFSKGIHSKSDEECLILAEITRNSLVLLVEEIYQRIDRLHEYKEGIEKAKQRLDKESGKNNRSIP